ncbi:hypothetical protein HanRHA438_Chr01g0031961 [Helianthus annuus]|nr:hypothetical protein HanHA89_Chr01g0027571 [Helianthus annuus]KAJ0948820.1 hypothetical protein HanRHA438_Chr01g0031961 [Helianthus annuus]
MIVCLWRIRCYVERCTIFIIRGCLYSARYRFVLLFIKGRTRNQLTRRITLKNYASPGVFKLGMSLRINMRKINRSKDLELLILFKEVMKMEGLHFS